MVYRTRFEKVIRSIIVRDDPSRAITHETKKFGIFEYGRSDVRISCRIIGKPEYSLKIPLPDEYRVK